MQATGYTVQKLTRQYSVTRLAAEGDETLTEDLQVERTPLRKLANAILDDCGLAAPPRVARAFAAQFLRPLSAQSAAVVTISGSRIRHWADYGSADLERESA